MCMYDVCVGADAGVCMEVWGQHLGVGPHLSTFIWTFSCFYFPGGRSTERHSGITGTCAILCSFYQGSGDPNPACQAWAASIFTHCAICPALRHLWRPHFTSLGWTTLLLSATVLQPLISCARLFGGSEALVNSLPPEDQAQKSTPSLLWVGMKLITLWYQ